MSQQESRQNKRDRQKNFHKRHPRSLLQMEQAFLCCYSAYKQKLMQLNYRGAINTIFSI